MSNNSAEEFGSSLASNNEDLDFLAACAVSRNFSLLTDGVVELKHMRPQVARYAAYIMEQKAASPHNWPPNLASLRQMFHSEEYPWPDFDDAATEIDPQLYANLLHESYRRHLLLQALYDGHNAIAAAEQYLLPECQKATAAAIKKLTESLEIGSGTKDYEIGSGISLTEILTGGGASSVFFDTPWPAFNDMVKLFRPGIYGFYARPKSGKSFMTVELAAHLAFTRGLAGFYVDPENSTEELLKRVACCVSEVPVDAFEEVEYKSMQMRRRDLSEDQRNAYALNNVDLQILEHFAQVESYLASESSKLVIRGVQSGGEFRERFNIHRIIEQAHSRGVDWIVVEQIHKMWADTAKENDTDTTRIQKVVAAMSAETKFRWFVSTQENRSGGATPTKWHDPKEGATVLGSDSLLQECLVLSHIRRFDLDTKEVEYIDRFGVSRTCKRIQMFWPLVGRGLREGKPIFRYVDFYGLMQPINSDVALSLLKHDMDVKAQRQGDGGKSDGAGRGKARAVSARPSPASIPDRGPQAYVTGGENARKKL